MSAEEILEPDYNKAEQKALEVLDMFGYTTKPPVNPLVITDEYAIEVLFFEVSGEHKNVSGFFDKDKNIIYVNKKESAQRQMFTIAHELGHKLLHEEWLKTSGYSVLMRDNLIKKSSDSKEKEANYFAANLLVPERMLNKYCKEYKITDIQTLAKIFGVSEVMMFYRLKQMKKI